LMNISARFDEY